MRLGLMSLGDMIVDPISGWEATAADRHRMIIEAAVIADRGGFYSINIGEHHGIDYAFSAPPVLLSAIAERTSRLKLSTAVALAANLDTFRLAEDYATVDVLSGGRVEIIAGRGNFFESTYALFGQTVDSSAQRFTEAMELLCTLWQGNPVHWEGRFRSPVNGEQLQPPPIRPDRLPFWVGGGSSPATAQLAGRLGLKLMLPSAFGRPDKFVPIVDIYRESFAASHHKHAAEVGACWHGWVARNSQDAIKRFEPRYRAYHGFTQQLMKRVNPNPPPYLSAPFDYELLRTKGPALVGSPAAFIDRLYDLNRILGAELNLVKMDMGGVPPGEYNNMLELMASEVTPVLNSTAATSARSAR